jgi:hypothetical protein
MLEWQDEFGEAGWVGFMGCRLLLDVNTLWSVARGGGGSSMVVVVVAAVRGVMDERGMV